MDTRKKTIRLGALVRTSKGDTFRVEAVERHNQQDIAVLVAPGDYLVDQRPCVFHPLSDLEEVPCE